MNPGESRFYAQNSSQSSGEDQMTSDLEALYYDTPRSKSGASSDGSSSDKKSKLQENKSGSSSDSSSSVKSSSSRRYKKSKSKCSLYLLSLKSQVTSQKVFIETEL